MIRSYISYEDIDQKSKKYTYKLKGGVIKLKICIFSEENILLNYSTAE